MAEQGQPKPGQIIGPGPNPQPALDVAEAARKQAARATPTDRLEARFDRHIEDLKADKVALRADLKSLQTRDLVHLRDDVRWLEEKVAALEKALIQLKTSYDFVIAFNWLSFALIAVGGCVVSYAAFLPDSQTHPAPWYRSRKFVATLAFAALVIGVIIQAFLSYRGNAAVSEFAKLSSSRARPSPNPVASAVDASS